MIPAQTIRLSAKERNEKGNLGIREGVLSASDRLSCGIDLPELTQDLVKRRVGDTQALQADRFAAGLDQEPVHVPGNRRDDVSQGRGVQYLVEPENVLEVLDDVPAVNLSALSLALFEVQPCACLESHKVFRPDN